MKVKEPKPYSYIKDLQEKIIVARLECTGPIAQQAVLDENDPRRISKTLVGNDVPELGVLVERQFSRHALGSETHQN